MRITNALIAAVFLTVVLSVLNDEQTDPHASAGVANGTAAASVAGSIQAGPKATSARIKGKNLIVSGEDFDYGATILINGKRQKTENDEDSPMIALIGKKVGKKIGKKFGLDQIVILQVQNSNGMLSEELLFHTGCGSQT